MSATQPRLFGSGWIEVRDGDPSGLAMFERHYSAEKSLALRRRRGTKLFVGPGDRLVLIQADARALFVWRRERPEYRADGQVGVNCAVFRNEGAGVASALILAAEALAWARWPGERLFTFVDPRKVRGDPPGNCFRRAGWSPCGATARGLLIFEKHQDAAAPAARGKAA